MTTFQGRTYLVSGASSGIGEATAALFHQKGAHVIGLASNAASLSAAAARHPKIRWLAADVSKRAEVDRVFSEVEQLDGIINNAGIYPFAPLEASTEDMIRRLFDVNVLGLISLTQAALPALRKNKGTIVNVSSTAAQKALPNQSIYSATKAAVESLTRSWALELAPHGIRVNAVSPGPTMTPGIANMPVPREVFEKMKQEILKAIPLARPGASEEVAHWIVTLSDPIVTWVTGQVIGVDGGFSVT